MSSKECLLKRVEELEIKAKAFGFYWEELSQLMEQIHSECTEIQEAFDKGDRTHLQEEAGDLIMAAISLAVFCNLDPHITLSKSIQKFEQRYKTLVELANKDGLKDLREQPFEILMHYWKQAKLHGKK